jgi:ankyrin repeat protein
MVRTLCEGGAQLHKSIDGFTPLGAAASLGKPAAVAQLLLCSANPNRGHVDGSTPLWLAVQGGYAACVEALAPVSDLSVKVEAGMTAPFVLAFAGLTAKLDRDCVRTMLSHAGAALDMQAADGFTPLTIAALKNDAACIKLLAEAGADLNARNREECSPLMVAAAHGAREATDALLELGADAKAVRPSNGTTALMAAASSGRASCIEALAPFSDMNARCSRGDAAIHFAICSRAAAKRSAALASLLKLGCDRTLLAKDGQSGLHMACLSGDAECVRLLLGGTGDAMRVADVNLQEGQKGFTPLMCAIQSGSVPCVQMLLAAGARRLFKSGDTFVRRACQFHPGNAELRNLLDPLIVRSKPLVCDCCAREAALDECACGAAWYCSGDCQSKALAAHQRRCKALCAERALRSASS